jgi:hypothetical protein
MSASDKDHTAISWDEIGVVDVMTRLFVERQIADERGNGGIIRTAA